VQVSVNISLWIAALIGVATYLFIGYFGALKYQIGPESGSLFALCCAVRCALCAVIFGF
jgi:hypothetical protein